MLVLYIHNSVCQRPELMGSNSAFLSKETLTTVPVAAERLPLVSLATMTKAITSGFQQAP